MNPEKIENYLFVLIWTMYKLKTWNVKNLLKHPKLFINVKKCLKAKLNFIKFMTKSQGFSEIYKNKSNEYIFVFCFLDF